MDAQTYEAKQNATYRELTGRDLLMEVRWESFQMQYSGVGAQWTHEATRHDNGDMLFTKVNYGGFATARWTSVIVKQQENGSYKIYRQMKMPAIKQSSKSWTLTQTGFMHRQPNGRA